MKLTFKRREVSDLQHLRSLVSDNSDAMEPGLKILASNLNLGRTTVDLAALDAQDRPVLFVLGLTADDVMLVRALEAYAWCLEYPESIQRLVPASVRPGWPPRIVFVAERLLEAFVRKMRLLSFSAVDCFEFRYVEANGTAGFYLDRVDWAPAVAETATARSERAVLPAVDERVELRDESRIAPREEPRVAPREESRSAPREESRVASREESRAVPREERAVPREERTMPREERVVAREERVVPREEPKVVLLREEVRDGDHGESDEEPVEDEVAELREELDEEPKVTPRDEPKVIPLVPVDEPRIVMLHETKPAPRSIEPAPTNGARKADTNERPEQRERPERSPVLLKGLRPPSDAPPRRRSREVPDLLRPSAEQRPSGPREAPSPPAPAASRAPHVEPKVTPAPGSRVSQSAGVEQRAKNDAARVDASRNGSKGDGARTEVPKGDLAPTWRKFLDRLTSTFDARTGAVPEPPRAAAPPSTPTAPPSLTLQPFAADIEVQAHEVAPDEVVDESSEAVAEVSDNQRRVLQGVTMPDNGELAPQWRKFLDHPALDETKIGVVRGYLQREFPLCTVYDFYDFQRNAQVYQLQDNHGKVTQLITMTAEFFDSHRDLEIRAWIEKHRLAQAMRQAGQAGVLVSQAGLQIEKR
jgi:hypothetical protein